MMENHNFGFPLTLMVNKTVILTFKYGAWPSKLTTHQYKLDSITSSTCCFEIRKLGQISQHLYINFKVLFNHNFTLTYKYMTKN